ncbi:MAG: hypothetical protein H0U76_22130 [Ktedonobacteraceae bacterium]|nr:hypothetical protein [Ktedonobacteraceae bacterium]
MIAVLLEREGFQDHSYCAYGEIQGASTLWRLLKEPALEFLHRLKYECPGLEFKARVHVIHHYMNDGLVPELVLTIFSSTDLDLAQSLLQKFVDTHAHLVTGQD